MLNLLFLPKTFIISIYYAGPFMVKEAPVDWTNLDRNFHFIFPSREKFGLWLRHVSGPQPAYNKLVWDMFVSCASSIDAHSGWPLLGHKKILVIGYGGTCLWNVPKSLIWLMSHSWMPEDSVVPLYSRKWSSVTSPLTTKTPSYKLPESIILFEAWSSHSTFAD